MKQNRISDMIFFFNLSALICDWPQKYYIPFVFIDSKLRKNDLALLYVGTYNADKPTKNGRVGVWGGGTAQA